MSNSGYVRIFISLCLYIHICLLSVAGGSFIYIYIYMYAEHGIQGLSPGPIVKQLCDLMLTRPLMSHHSLPLRWIIRRVSQLSRDVGQLLPYYGSTGRRQCLRRSRRFHWDQKILRCRLLICVNRLKILLFISLECAGGRGKNF